MRFFGLDERADVDVVWFRGSCRVRAGLERRTRCSNRPHGMSPRRLSCLELPTNPPRSRVAALARFTQRLWRSDWRSRSGVIGRVAGGSVLPMNTVYKTQIEQKHAPPSPSVLSAEPPIVVLKRA